MLSKQNTNSITSLFRFFCRTKSFGAWFHIQFHSFDAFFTMYSNYLAPFSSTWCIFSQKCGDDRYFRKYHLLSGVCNSKVRGSSWKYSRAAYNGVNNGPKLTKGLHLCSSCSRNARPPTATTIRLHCLPQVSAKKIRNICQFFLVIVIQSYHSAGRGRFGHLISCFQQFPIWRRWNRITEHRRDAFTLFN